MKNKEDAALHFINTIRAMPIFPLNETDPEKLYALKKITYGPRKEDPEAQEDEELDLE